MSKLDKSDKLWNKFPSFRGKKPLSSSSDASLASFAKPSEEADKFKGPLGLTLLHDPPEPLADFVFVSLAVYMMYSGTE